MEDICDAMKLAMEIAEIGETAGIDFIGRGHLADGPNPFYNQIDMGTYALATEIDVNYYTNQDYLPSHLYTPWGQIVFQFGFYNTKKLDKFWAGLRQRFPAMRRYNDNPRVIIWSLNGAEIKYVANFSYEEVTAMKKSKCKPMLAPLVQR